MKYPIRILHVLGALNRGGAETMIMNLYRNIDRSKVQFDFIIHTKNECDYNEEIKSLGGKIYSIPKYNGKNHLEYKKKWNIFFSEHPEYKIIHGHVRSTASIYLKIAKRYGLTTIAHSHNTSSGKGITAIAKNILQYKIRYIADYLFACSLIAGEWLYGKKACKQKNFYVIKNAIDTKEYVFNQQIRDRLRKEFNIEDKFVIGHVGRFHEQKNHKFLIQVFYELQKEKENSVLLLVGDGALRTEIKQQIKKLGIESKVILAGVVSNVSDYMQVMDVFVFPSIFEGLPVTLVEAQAIGLDCIISDKITSEVCISTKITMLSLNDSISIWKNMIIKKEKREYTNMDSCIRKHGFEIGDTVKKLTLFYLGLQRV